MVMRRRRSRKPECAAYVKGPLSAMERNGLDNKISQIQVVSALPANKFDALLDGLCEAIAYARCNPQERWRSRKGTKKHTLRALVSDVDAAMKKAGLAPTRWEVEGESCFYKLIRTCCEASKLDAPTSLRHVTKPNRTPQRDP